MIDDVINYLRSKIKNPNAYKIKWDNMPKELYDELNSYFPKLNLTTKQKSVLLLNGYFSENDFPKCPICNKPVRVFGRIKRIFFKTCSTECENKLRLQSTTLSNNEKYGVDNVFQLYEVKNKIKTTMLNKYGSDNIRKTQYYIEHAYKTNIERYGCYNPFGNKDVQNKIYKTNIERYGDKCAFKNFLVQEKYRLNSLIKYDTLWPSQCEFIKDKIKKTNLERYGVISPLQLPHVRNARLLVPPSGHNSSNAFSHSQQEKTIFNMLISVFPNTLIQYKSKLYPWWCDFYIPEIDTYIEYQGYWTHSDHPYNPSSQIDEDILNDWKNKAKNHLLYDSAIKTWTISDPLKRKTAKENGLNYIEFWNIDEVKQWLKQFEF